MITPGVILNFPLSPEGGSKGCTTQTARFDHAITADEATAKMADGAPRLPKWQLQQILYQTLCQIGIANIMPKNIFIFSHFFYLQMTI
jgi:hypothetical protein